MSLVLSKTPWGQEQMEERPTPGPPLWHRLALQMLAVQKQRDQGWNAELCSLGHWRTMPCRPRWRLTHWRRLRWWFRRWCHLGRRFRRWPRLRQRLSCWSRLIIMAAQSSAVASLTLCVSIKVRITTASKVKIKYSSAELMELNNSLHAICINKGWCTNCPALRLWNIQ